MKTRDFTNDAEVVALVDAFETATIPPSQFDHAAHVAVAVSYVAQLPLADAQARMREGLLHFTAVNNVAEPGEAGQLLRQETTLEQKDASGRSWATQLIDPIGYPSGAKRVDLYHETVTTFWMRLLDHVIRTYDVGGPLWQRVNLIVERWGNSGPVRAHYSRELIASKVAREEWVPPDKLPLPF